MSIRHHTDVRVVVFFNVENKWQCDKKLHLIKLATIYETYFKSVADKYLNWKKNEFSVYGRKCIYSE